ncbi:MAG: D-alanine--D-alanine ligase [Acidobacteriota bacterium]|nr:D-alanine--D-alanine ligase [Acidobacteriota bacterium]
MSIATSSTPSPPDTHRFARGPLRVVVLAGGLSAEHDVSLASAASIREALARAGHEVHAVTIARDGAWLHDGSPAALVPGGGLLGADVAFPALHGPFGEDGVVQGVLEALGIPYVGAGVATSALCMDKVLFKDLMGAAGVPQVAYRSLTAHGFAADPESELRGLAALGLPVFVKPARMGSSLGIAKVSKADDLAAALAHAFEHDDLVIVEAMASGIEVECALFGDCDAPLASTPGQIVLAGDWYDFAAKYTPGGMDLVVPAPISDAAAERVRKLAGEVFARVRCRDLARADFFVDGEEVLLNELNTMPGFTPTSVYAKLVEHSGMHYPELVERLCRLALQRQVRLRATS